MNAVAPFWRNDRRAIRSNRRPSAPSGNRNNRTTRMSSGEEDSAGLKGNSDVQAERAPRPHSRVDGACALETTIRRAGISFCRGRSPTTQPAPEPPNAAPSDHGMAAAAHGTPLIDDRSYPETACPFWAAISPKRIQTVIRDVSRINRPPAAARQFGAGARDRKTGSHASGVEVLNGRIATVVSAGYCHDRVQAKPRAQ